MRRPPTDARRARPRCRRHLAVIASLCVLGLPVHAHEIGTTRVTLTLAADGEYVVDVTADAAALLGRLETASGQARSGALAPGEYATRLSALREEFTRHALVMFDGQAAAPSDVSVESSGATPSPDAFVPPAATVHLRGRIPPGAHSVTWSYDLTYASYALTLKSPRTTMDKTEWLEGGRQSMPFALGTPVAAHSRPRIALTYFSLGFTHILPNGLDHILFVLGIFLFSRRLKHVLWQVSAFTIAHSITLGLTLYGVVSLSPSIVEPMIALSIVYVAVENLFTTELKPWRIGFVFAFGLLHGMGFAGVLRELGLPRSEFLTGLIAFNAGVEGGQLAVIGTASLLVAHWSSNRRVYRRLVVVPGSATIALTGLYWTIVRLHVW